jgi:hypothetical protein
MLQWEDTMRLLRYLAFASLVLAACSSSDSTSGGTDEHGCVPGETYCHGCNGSGFCSMGGCPGFQCAEPIAEGGSSGGSGGTSETDASSGTGVGGASGSSGTSGAAGSSGTASDGGPGSCDSTFKNALVKDCQSETDCALLNHNDCCGTVVIAVKKGTEATFAAAESAYQTCVPGCGLRGCFHADLSEDMKPATSPGQIVAVCQNKICRSTIP